MPAEALSYRACRRPASATVEIADSVLLRVAGLGADRARQAAEALLERGARALVSWGLAGGLDPEFAPGELLLPVQILACDGSAYDTDAAWLRRAEARLAGSIDPRAVDLLESSTVLADPAAKASCYERTRAAGVDMESAAVAAAAARSGVPFLAVRAVCDAAHMPIPKCALHGLGPGGHLRPLRILVEIGRRPWEIGAVLELRRAFRAALATLRKVAVVMGPRLVAPS